MYALRRPLLILAVAVAGCATPRAPWATMSVSGRITAADFFASTPMGLTSQTVALPVGASTVKVPGLLLPTQTYIYQLKLSDGRTVRAQSNRSFSVGDCVTLWHAGAAEQAAGEFNFVPGDLEFGGKCS